MMPNMVGDVNVNSLWVLVSTDRCAANECGCGAGVVLFGFESVRKTVPPPIMPHAVAIVAAYRGRNKFLSILLS